MDLLKMIAELGAEKQRLDNAIEALERLSKIRRCGRPPKSLKEEKQRQVGAGSEKVGKGGTRTRAEPQEEK